MEPEMSGWIEIKEHPEAGAYQIANCLPGNPVQPLVILNHFGLRSENWLEELNESTKPVMTNLEAADNHTINVEFSAPTYARSPNFFVYDAVDTADTIPVADVETADGVAYILTLDDSMTEGNDYIVDATDYCRELSDPWSLGVLILCANIQGRLEFGSVATMLEFFDAASLAGKIEISWRLSSIDDGGRFDIHRGEGENGFATMAIGLDESGWLSGAGGLTSFDGLSFSYVDDTALPGRSYRYRIEYSLDGEPRALFTTEPIAIPAASLALDQNHPNPFNPSTTISYNLPAVSYVSLAIHDVTGRKVRTLVSAIQDPGSKSVEWNGLDDDGSPVVSGIYFYRLRAGKEELARKMVLMR